MGTFTHHHLVFCLTTGSTPPPRRFLHIVRSRASSFKCEYPLLSLRSSSSFLRLLLPHLLVTSVSPFIFPSITCFRRQFLRKMWPIQLAFRFLIECRIGMFTMRREKSPNNPSEISNAKSLISIADKMPLKKLYWMRLFKNERMQLMCMKLWGN
jgi:hypothetical protein